MVPIITAVWRRKNTITVPTERGRPLVEEKESLAFAPPPTAAAPDGATAADGDDDLGLLLGPPPERRPSRGGRALRTTGRTVDVATRALSQRPVLLGALSATVSGVAMAWNLFGYPKLDDTEGATVYQATSLLHGTGAQTIATYGHVPGGPMLLAGWTRLLDLTGDGFGLFDGLTSIERGRVLVVVLAALEALLLFIVLRRLTGYDILATGGALLFALSPLESWYGRTLHPQTFAAFWLTLALALALPGGRARIAIPRAALAGLAFGVAVASLETAIVVAPGLALIAWSGRRGPWRLLAGGVGAVIPVVALVIWLASNHVFAGSATQPSFIGNLAATAAQQHDSGFFSSHGHFWHVKDVWSALQPFFIILCGLSSVWLTAVGRGPLRRGIGLMALAFWALFASGINIQDYFVVLAMPVWVVASVVGPVDFAERRFVQKRLWGLGVLGRVWGVTVVVGLLLLGPSIPSNAVALGAQDASIQSDLTVWLRIHVPAGAAVVDNGSDSFDLVNPGLDGRDLSVVCTYFDAACIHKGDVTEAYIVDNNELRFLAANNSFGDAALRRLALTGDLAWSASGLTDGDYIHVFRVAIPPPGGGLPPPTGS